MSIEKRLGARLAWTRAQSRWTLRQWRDVVFTDDSRFCLQINNGRVRVYRRRGERFATNWVLEADGNRGGSVIQHTARIVADHLANLGIAVCIEHLLDQLERRVRAQEQPKPALEICAEPYKRNG